MVHPSLEAKGKRKHKKQKYLNDPPPNKKPVKVVHQVLHTSGSSSEGEGDSVAELAEALSTYDVGNSEFDDAFDLTKFPAGLRDRMLAAAPVLGGRHAEYTDDFFRDCVGLCDRGPLVDDVPKVYPMILESDIKAVWPAGAQPNRYEISNCKDANQVRLFSRHNYQVYGNRPDNAYFAMRFLKAAYATFVHGKDVNWLAEAQGRRTRRLKRASKNPRKTGPVALRRQMEGLCDIILNLKTGTPTRRVVPRTVEGAQRDLDAARCAQAEAMKALLEMQKTYEDAKKSISACSDEEYAKLEAQSSAASAEQKRLYRSGTASEFKVAAELAGDIAEKLDELQEAQMIARATMRDLDAGALDKAFADEHRALEDVGAAEAALLKAKEGNLVLRPRRVFEYPIGQSVPAIESRVGELCPACSKGFVAKAAVLGPCGCLFHNVCVAQMIDSNSKVCPGCISILDPAWVAQWDGQADENQEREIEATIAKLKNVIVDGTNPAASPPKLKMKGASLLSQFEAPNPMLGGAFLLPDCQALNPDPVVSAVLSEFEPDKDDPIVSEAYDSFAAADILAEEGNAEEDALVKSTVDAGDSISMPTTAE